MSWSTTLQRHGASYAFTASTAALVATAIRRNLVEDENTTFEGISNLSSSSLFTPSYTFCDAQVSESPRNNKNRIVFLGTGSSTGCPAPRCLMLFSSKEEDPSDAQRRQRDFFRDKCHVSLLASQGDPRHNRNYRNNPSLLISYESNQGTTEKGDAAAEDSQPSVVRNIIIDVGKTFREGAIRWFDRHNISTVDAVILTHEHADAVFGLDDLRGIQTVVPPSDTAIGARMPTLLSLPLHVSQHCLDRLARQFPWLFPNQQQTVTQQGPSSSSQKKGPKVKRFVASLDVQVFESFQPFRAAGLEVIPLPVLHGADLVSFGFAFTINKTNIVYLSDITHLLPESLEFIQKKLPETDILIVDALYPDKTHTAHYSLQESVDDLVQTIKPRKAVYFVGMTCDAYPPHDEMNELLREYHSKDGKGEDFPKMRFAHDGLEVTC